jgi:hypothetical protein
MAAQNLPSDLPLISAYAKAIVAERIAAGELAAAPVIDGKPSPWLPIWVAQCRAVTTLSRMLGPEPRRSRAVEIARGAGADTAAWHWRRAAPPDDRGGGRRGTEGRLTSTKQEKAKDQ